MITVRFARIDEFCTELSREAAQIDRKILRLSRLWRSGSPGRVFVVASALVEGPRPQVLQMEVYCGSEMAGHPEPAVSDKVDKTLTRLRTHAASLGLQVRGGMIRNEPGHAEADEAEEGTP